MVYGGNGGGVKPTWSGNWRCCWQLLSIIIVRCCPAQELHGLRQQAQIWCDSQHSEGDKLKAEVELLNAQLMQRSSEVSSIREQLTQARTERDRALQEKQQVSG